MIDLDAFEAECRRDIPLLNAMQLSLVDYGDLELAMEAPLAPNINNKGTAFGGSIASICLFGGWAVSTLAFAERGIVSTEIVVYRNEMIFERPARGHLVVTAGPEPESFDACVEALAAGSDERLRFDVGVDVFHDEARCARMRGEYVVWLR
ncbi:MAG: YiiD C-terminal domain-containing protein [Woeseiaceae bacterium]|jgi:thioesterase domain-containing protein